MTDSPDNKTLIIQKTQAFLRESYEIDAKKKRLTQKFIEEIHTLGDKKTLQEIDDMLNQI
jgi:uncharacterized protein YpiB (UPF0302 family)